MIRDHIIIGGMAVSGLLALLWALHLTQPARHAPAVGQRWQTDGDCFTVKSVGFDRTGHLQVYVKHDGEDITELYATSLRVWNKRLRAEGRALSKS